MSWRLAPALTVTSARRPGLRLLASMRWPDARDVPGPHRDHVLGGRLRECRSSMEGLSPQRIHQALEINCLAKSNNSWPDRKFLHTREEFPSPKDRFGSDGN